MTIHHDNLTFNTLRAVNFPQSLVLKATGLNSAGNLVSGSSAIFVGYNHTARTVVVDTQAPVQGAVTRLTIPNVIFAGMFGFLPAELFKIEDPTERNAPKVSFA